MSRNAIEQAKKALSQQGDTSKEAAHALLDASQDILSLALDKEVCSCRLCPSVIMIIDAVERKDPRSMIQRYSVHCLRIGKTCTLRI